MGFFDFLKFRKKSDNFGIPIGKGPSSAGVSVNAVTAMRHQTVYTCVRILAESIGQLPVKLVKEAGGRFVEEKGTRLARIFTKKPNNYQTMQEFIETLVTSLMCNGDGNFYAELVRNRHGSIAQLVPFKDQRSVSVQMDAVGQVYFNYVTNGGKSLEGFAGKDLLHIKLNSANGYKALSPIAQNLTALGLSMACEEHAASTFENGAFPKTALKMEDSLQDQDAIDRLRDQWNEVYKGNRNAGKTVVLEHGLNPVQLELSPVDAQLLEQRKLSREQIAAIFRVPVHMLNDSSTQKYSNVEQNNLSFFRDALMPIITRIENNLNLLLPDGYEVKFDEKQFTRGDRKSQVDNVKKEISAGVLSINDGRIELGREPIEGGDVYAISTNNLSFGRYEDLDKITEQANKKPKETE